MITARTTILADRIRGAVEQALIGANLNLSQASLTVSRVLVEPETFELCVAIDEGAGGFRWITRIETRNFDHHLAATMAQLRAWL
jgi:hypothetical protein